MLKTAMRFTLFVVSVLLSMVIGLQAFIVFSISESAVHSSFEIDPSNVRNVSLIGMFVAAFVLNGGIMLFNNRFRWLPPIFYSVATILAFYIASYGYYDMNMWGWIIAVVGMLSGFAVNSTPVSIQQA